MYRIISSNLPFLVRFTENGIFSYRVNVMQFFFFIEFTESGKGLDLSELFGI